MELVAFRSIEEIIGTLMGLAKLEVRQIIRFPE